MRRVKKEPSAIEKAREEAKRIEREGAQATGAPGIRKRLSGLNLRRNNNNASSNARKPQHSKITPGAGATPQRPTPRRSVPASTRPSPAAAARGAKHSLPSSAHGGSAKVQPVAEEEEEEEDGKKEEGKGKDDGVGKQGKDGGGVKAVKFVKMSTKYNYLVDVPFLTPEEEKRRESALQPHPEIQAWMLAIRAAQLSALDHREHHKQHEARTEELSNRLVQVSTGFVYSNKAKWYKQRFLDPLKFDIQTSQVATSHAQSSAVRADKRAKELLGDARMIAMMSDVLDSARSEMERYLEGLEADEVAQFEAALEGLKAKGSRRRDDRVQLVGEHERGRAVQYAVKLWDEAKAVLPALTAALNKLLAEAEVPQEGREVHSGVKGMARGLEKSFEEKGVGDFSVLNDVAQAVVVVPTLPCLTRLINGLVAGSDIRIVAVENTLSASSHHDFGTPNRRGPPSAHVTILARVPAANAHLCEIQLHLTDLHDISGRGLVSTLHRFAVQQHLLAHEVLQGKWSSEVASRMAQGLVREAYLDFAHVPLDALVEALSSEHCRVRRLSLMGSVGANEKGKPPRRPFQLTHLNLSMNEEMEDEVLTNTFGHCNSLRCLELRECAALTDASLEIMLAANPHLNEVDLTKCKKVVEALGVLADLCPMVRELSVSSTGVATAGVAQAVEALGGRLKRLHVAHVKVDDDTLFLIAEKAHNLTDLDVSWTRISADSIEDLASLPRLQCLRLYHTRVSDFGLVEMTKKAMFMRSIRVLDLANTRVNDTGVMAALQVAASSLVELSLKGLGVSDAIAESLGKCSDLEDLDLSETGLGDRVLDAIAEGCARLQVIALSGTKVTTQGARRLVESCAALVSVVATATDVDEDLVEELRDSHVDLTFVV